MPKGKNKTVNTNVGDAGGSGKGRGPVKAPNNDKQIVQPSSDNIAEKELFAGTADTFQQPGQQEKAGGKAVSVFRHIIGGPTGRLITLRAGQIRQLAKDLSTLQKILLAGIALVSIVLVYALVSSIRHKNHKATTKTTVQRKFTPVNIIERQPKLTDYQTPETRTQKLSITPAPPEEPTSLRFAESLYMQKDYAGAYAVYDEMEKKLDSGEHRQLFRDLLCLKKVFCLLCMDAGSNPFEPNANSPRIDKAAEMLQKVSESRSPILRVAANYYLGVLALRQKRYLEARARAYKSLGLIGVVGSELAWSSKLERETRFVAAEALTRHVLALCDADKELPPDLWTRGAWLEDPFVNMNHEQLIAHLTRGLEQLQKGLLSPQLGRLEQIDQPSRSARPYWFVCCQNTPVQELLARFAVNAGLDVRWMLTGATKQQSAQAIRNRPVVLYMPAVTPLQLITVAAGSAALMAELEPTGVIKVYNPREYNSLAEHISILSRQAVALWQQFILAFHGDNRIGNAHFAIALLKTQQELLSDAIAEYKLVSNQFSQTPLAPYALLHSSKLKSRLRDYPGARKDLKQLLAQYPDSKLCPKACLYLAEATKNAGLLAEAARLYGKVYNIGYSNQLRAAAAFGAGKCFYEQKDYLNTVKWLNRYVALSRDRESEQFYTACFLLGKSNLALGNLEQACKVLEHALSGHPPRERFLQTISAIVEVRMQQGNFIEALNVLEAVHPWQFSSAQYAEVLILKARLFRSIGLFDKAIATIGDRVEYEPDPYLKARLSLELSKCYTAKGELQTAQKILSEVITQTEPGPPDLEVALELAGLCLKLGQTNQVISLCRQVLSLTPPAETAQKARRLLALAFSRESKYDNAALALAGSVKRQTD